MEGRMSADCERSIDKPCSKDSVLILSRDGLDDSEVAFKLCFAAVRDTNVSNLPPSPVGVVDSEKLGLCVLSSGTFQIGRLLTGGGFLIAGVGGSGELGVEISGFGGGFGKGLSIVLNFLAGF